MNKAVLPENVSGSQAIILQAILFAGVVLRIVQWSAGTSVDPEEAALALNILGKSYGELFGVLEYFQSQPVGYLLTLKFVTSLLGSSEQAFRLVALLAGMASLFLFVRIAGRHLDFFALAVVTALLVLSDQLILFSAQIRPYSVDMMIAALVLNFYSPEEDVPGSSLKGRIAFVITGVAAVWFSYPSIFIYGSFGAFSLLLILKKRRLDRAGSWMTVYLPVFASFAVYYFFNIRELSEQVAKHTEEMRPDSFLPVSITSFGDLSTYLDNFVSFFRDPLGMSLQALGAFLFLCGAVSLYKADRKRLCLLLMPILLTLIAMMLRKYLPHARRLHFLVPFVLLVAGEGVRFLQASMSGRTTALRILVFMMLFTPVILAGRHLLSPWTTYEMKSAIQYAKKNWRPGDRIYVTWRAATAAEYYRIRGLVNPGDVIVAPAHKDMNITVARLNELKQYARVWLFHADSPAGDIERAQAFLDMSGRAVHQRQFERILVQLYVFPGGR